VRVIHRTLNRVGHCEKCFSFFSIVLKANWYRSVSLFYWSLWDCIFFCRARVFWNHTWVICVSNPEMHVKQSEQKKCELHYLIVFSIPAIWAIDSKLACKICNCSSVYIVLLCVLSILSKLLITQPYLPSYIPLKCSLTKSTL
jgi:hypothetical protein